MARWVALALAAGCIIVAPARGEEDKRNALERYQGDGEFSMIMCKLALRMNIAKSELGQDLDEKSDYRKCINDGQATAKANLATALKLVRKPKAKEALKSYHVSWSTALEGIAPGANERKVSYEQRQQALKDKLNEAWARFEVEQ